MERNPQTFCVVEKALKSDKYLATSTGTGIDCRGFEEMLVIVNSGTFVGAASVVVTIEESSASDGSGDAFVAVLTFPAITTANDIEAKHLGRIRLPQGNRYYRAVATYTGNGSTEFAPLGVDFVKMWPRDSALANDTYDANSGR